MEELEVIAHFGIHKTASTFFQSKVFPEVEGAFFLDRSMAQPFKDYILCADDFDFSGEQAHAIFMELVDKYSKDDGCSKVIISDEEFYGNPYIGAIDRKRIVDRFVSTFGKRLKVLIVLRNQVDLLSSLYTQYVKTGGTASSKEFLVHKKYPLNVSDAYFRFHGYVSYINNLLPSGNIKVCLYESFVHDRSAFVKDVGLFFGVNGLGDGLDLDERVNSRLSKTTLPIMRFVNLFGKSEKEPFLLVNGKLRRAFIKFLLKFFSTKGRAPSLRFGGEEEFYFAVKHSNQDLEKLMPELKLSEKGYPIESIHDTHPV